MFRIKYIAIFGLTFLLGGCAAMPKPEEKVEDDCRVEFLIKKDAVSLMTKAIASPSPLDYYPQGENFVEKGDYNAGSRIRVCSVTRERGTDVPVFNSGYTTENVNGYHDYECNALVDYPEYSVFRRWDKDKPGLIWTKYKADGSVEVPGNVLQDPTTGGFFMFAEYYPCDNIRPDRGNNVMFVNTDQSYGSATQLHYHLMRNDILLCHKYFTIRQDKAAVLLDFRHALSMLVVNVELPYDKLGIKGFTEETLKGKISLELQQVAIDFTPDYTQRYNVNDVVTVTVPKGASTNNIIKMYRTPNFTKPYATTHDSSVDPGFDPFADKYGDLDYLWTTDKAYDGTEGNHVWMQFCCIIPPQRLYESSNSNPCLVLTFGEGVTKRQFRYMFTGQGLNFRGQLVSRLDLGIGYPEKQPVLLQAKFYDWSQDRTEIITLYQ
ncbi:MAG: hypothetical protein HUJ95_04065 [Bacteroidales bacterium]|nr:hypothetical protein [Bacteroidales bacterium]